jgi:hypothetical protein
MQAFFDNADQHASSRVNDAFRHSRRAARIHDQERIPERNSLKLQHRAPLRRLQEGAKRDSSWQALEIRWFTREPRLRNDTLELLHAFHALDNVPNLGPQVDRLTIVYGPIVYEDIRRLDLQQPLQDSLGPHICAAGAEQAPETHHGHERDERVETRTRHDRHTVPFLDTMRAHRIRQQPDAAAQFAP